MAFTKKTIAEASTLERRLQQVRSKGYSLTHSEQLEGIVEVAVPVHNQRGQVVTAIDFNLYPASADQIKVVHRNVAILRKEIHEPDSVMKAQRVGLAFLRYRRVENCSTCEIAARALAVRGGSTLRSQPRRVNGIRYGSCGVQPLST
jgi:hypothetical protein